MSVRKSTCGKKWIVDVRDRSQGIRIRRSARTRKKAIEIENAVRNQVKNQKIPETGIEHALAEYLKGEAKNLRSYHSLLSKARAIRPYISGQTFQSIGLVQARIKKEMIGQNLKPATINRRLALLRRLGNLAFEWGWIEYPAGKRVKLLPGETERHYYLTINQIIKLAQECQNTGGIIKLAATTGLRRGEIMNLQPDQFIRDDHNAPIWIALGTNTKNKRPRMVPIPETIRSIIDKYHWPLDKTYNQMLRTEFEKAREKLNIKHIRFHDLRHSYASILAQGGIELKQLKELMGHSSLQMTNRYTHLLNQSLLEIVGRKFGAQPGADMENKKK